MNIVRFSDIVETNGKTIRENNLELQHKIPIGTLVEVKTSEWLGDGACEKIHARWFVAMHGRDCDGTPLYGLAARLPLPDKNSPMYWWTFRGFGYSEESLTVLEVTNELIRGEGALEWGEK